MHWDWRLDFSFWLGISASISFVIFFCLHMHYMAAFDWSMEDGRRLIDDAAGRSIR
jgi:hypothetical protein